MIAMLHPRQQRLIGLMTTLLGTLSNLGDTGKHMRPTVNPLSYLTVKALQILPNGTLLNNLHGLKTQQEGPNDDHCISNDACKCNEPPTVKQRSRRYSWQSIVKLLSVTNQEKLFLRWSQNLSLFKFLFRHVADCGANCSAGTIEKQQN